MGRASRSTFSVSHRASARRLAGRDLGDRHPLVVGVREHRIARTEVDGRDAQGREARDIRPAVLGSRLAADRRDELLGERGIESGTGALSEIDDGEVESGEQFAQVLDGLRRPCGSARIGS